MTGRPTLYTEEDAERILAELARGRALRAVCRDHGMPPYSAVRQWIADDRDGFAARYRQAQRIDGAGSVSRYSVAIAERSYAN
jgi:transposase-like protein